MRYILILLLITSIGCKKNQVNPKGEIRTVEGIVFEDCNGNVSKGKKIYLQGVYVGCFGGGIESQDSVITDNNGRYKFTYRQYVDDQSTTSRCHNLFIPNTLINVVNPSGDINFYPNDTTMNATIHLKFQNKYTANDTFYYQFKPTPKGFIEEPVQIQYLVGPFKDTVVTFSNVKIGNTNNVDNGKFHCGQFKWGIGILNLNRYYTGKDGSFSLNHLPCAGNDAFEYYVVPQ